MRTIRRIAYVASAALVAVVVVVVVRAAGTDRPATRAAVPDGPFLAMVIGGVPDGGTIERRDPTAVSGPWTVVVRRRDGSLGTHGAVVTFPVTDQGPGQPVRVGRVAGSARAGIVSWPIAGARARIRGDLTRPQLLAIAAATTVVSGRPAVRAPAGFAVVASAPYRSPSVQEVRYGTVSVGQDSALGAGLTYTGVVAGGGFEDQLYARAARRTTVGGRPAVISDLYGGNATLAWEPAPGLVAYVGYSGETLDDQAVAALRRLAERTRGLDRAQWQATNPATDTQRNDYS